MTILFETFTGPTEIEGAVTAVLRLRARSSAAPRTVCPLVLRVRARSGGVSRVPDDPPYGFGAAGLSMAVDAYGPKTNHGDAAIVLNLGARAFESADHCEIGLHVGGAAFDLSGADIPVVRSLIDRVGVAAPVSLHETRVLRARALLGELVQAQWEGTRTLRSHLELDVAMLLVYRELLASSAAIGAEVTVDYLAIAHMADALLLGCAVTSLREAHAFITEAFVLQALGSTFDYVGMADAVAFEAALASTYAGYARMVDEALIEATQTGTLQLVAQMADTVAFSAATIATLEGFALLRDQVDFAIRAMIDDELHVAWSVQGATKAATRYTNYPFNSFFRLPAGGGWVHYGLTDTGLYRLDGEDDDGDAINAHFRLGLSDLGERLMKRIDSAYIGYTGAGDLRLKVVVATGENGAREAHTYRLYQRNGASEEAGRVKCGKGLKAVYMDFVIENIDGGDFEIDCVEILPLWLERRIQGNAGGKP